MRLGVSHVGLVKLIHELQTANGNPPTIHEIEESGRYKGVLPMAVALVDVTQAGYVASSFEGRVDDWTYRLTDKGREGIKLLL